MDLFERKDLEKLPHIKYFLSRVSFVEGKYYFQELRKFDDAKEYVKCRKNELLQKVRECMTSRLEEEKESEEIFKHVPPILNCEGWDRKINVDGESNPDDEIVDDSNMFLIQNFETPLRSAGMRMSAADLIEQWHELLNYAREYLSLSAIILEDVFKA